METATFLSWGIGVHCLQCKLDFQQYIGTNDRHHWNLAFERARNYEMDHINTNANIFYVGIVDYEMCGMIF